MPWWKWFKAADILSLVRVNDRIQLELGSSSFLRRVEDIRWETLVIAAPVRMDQRSHDALAKFLLTVQRGETVPKAA